MSKELLNLFNWHSFVNCHGSQGPSKFMGMDFMEAQLTANLPQTNLNTADLQSLKRFQQRNKQGVIVIGPLFQISLKVIFVLASK